MQEFLIDEKEFRIASRKNKIVILKKLERSNTLEENKILNISYIEDETIYHKIANKYVNSKVVTHQGKTYDLKLRCYDTVRKFLAIKDVVPDVILLDIVLEEDSDKSLDNDEVYGKAKKRSFNLTKMAKSIFPNVVLIMHSSMVTASIYSKYMDAGADNYIIKDPRKF